jgi:uncharacterized protein (DUF2336 family)
VSLLENASARLSRETLDRVADRARSSTVLHAPFVRRQNIPLDLLNSIYLKVSAELRREIMGKFQGASAADIEVALEESRDHLSTAYGALPGDYQLAKEHVDDLARRSALQPAVLQSLLRNNNRTSFLIAFGRLTEVDYELASRLVDSKDIDALAILCRGARIERNLFVTLCMMIVGGGGGLSKAEAYGQLYEQVPVVAAQRALRFWNVRAKASAASAAA